MSGIEFGIAGWSYEDWRGIVYPAGCRDTLRFCAGFVDCIEINSSFYRVPEAKHSAAWAHRVGDLTTTFTAKLPQEITHQRMMGEEVILKVQEGFAPLVDAGRLRTLLAQFNFRFEHSTSNLDYLAQIRDAFSAIAPLTLELRHQSWTTAEATDQLRSLDVTVANLDYPGASSGFGTYVTNLNGPQNLAYFRLHGRNSKAWFSRAAGRDEVYDYLYSKEEVEQLARRATVIGHDAAHTVVIANNHFHGKAMKLVLELLAWYRKESVEVPSPLLQTYPSLQRIAKHCQGRLFDGG